MKAYSYLLTIIAALSITLTARADYQPQATNHLMHGSHSIGDMPSAQMRSTSPMMNYKNSFTLPQARPQSQVQTPTFKIGKIFKSDTLLLSTKALRTYGTMRGTDHVAYMSSGSHLASDGGTFVTTYDAGGPRYVRPGDHEQPYVDPEAPVGDMPLAMMAMLVAGYALRVRLRRKEESTGIAG